MSLIIIAIAPVLAIAFYVYIRDKYEKEPLKLLLLAMVSGVIIALPAILTEQFMTQLSYWIFGDVSPFWNAFMVASLCEESLKMLALYLIIWKNKEFNEKFDGIVYATFVSLGFAGIENILYVTEYGLTTGLTRALTAVPAHAIFGVAMGYYFGLAKFYPKNRRRFLQLSFIFPFVLHGIYDFILMSNLDFLLILFVPFVTFMWIICLK